MRTIIAQEKVTPSHPVTVTFVIPIASDEVATPFAIDVIDSHAVTSYPFAFTAPFPSSPVTIEMDVRCPHTGIYQVAKRLQGQPHSEQRWSVLIQEEND